MIDRSCGTAAWLLWTEPKVSAIRLLSLTHNALSDTAGRARCLVVVRKRFTVQPCRGADRSVERNTLTSCSYLRRRHRLCGWLLRPSLPFHSMVVLHRLWTTQEVVGCVLYVVEFQGGNGVWTLSFPFGGNSHTSPVFLSQKQHEKPTTARVRRSQVNRLQKLFCFKNYY